MYDISAVGLPKPIIGISREEKGRLARFHSRNLYNVCVPREVLVQYLQQPMMWSPFQFKDNYRTQANSNLTVGMLVFDSDDNTPMVRVKERFAAVFKHFIIMPSSGWTPDYEKFRIIVPLSQMVAMKSTEHYKNVMKYFAKKLDIELDKSTMETARFFFSDLNAGIEAYDTGGVNHVSILNAAALYKEPTKDGLAMLNEMFPDKRKRKFGVLFNKPLELKHILKNDKYLSYLGNIHAGNFHAGEVAMLGYLKNCGFSYGDIDSYIREIRSQCGGAATEEQHQNRMAVIR